MLQVNRLEYSARAEVARKSNKRFSFPGTLRLDDYMLRADCPASFDALFAARTVSRSAQYQLRCVVAHSGLASRGHFCSFLQVGKAWFRFDDARVSECPAQSVFALAGSKSTGSDSENAYCLFYSKSEC